MCAAFSRRKISGQHSGQHHGRAFGLMALLLTVTLASCSGDAMVPPGNVDNGTEVSSISPTPNEGPADLPAEPSVQSDETYAAPEQPVSENTDYLNTPNLAGVETPQKRLPKIDEEPAADTATMAPAEDGSVNMDQGLGVDNEVVGLAEEQSNDISQDQNMQDQIAEGQTTEPVVDGIGMDDPVEINRSKQANSVPFDETSSMANITPPSRRTIKEPQQEVAYVPRFSDPMQVPETYGGMSAADKACRMELKKLGVNFVEIDPIEDGPNCGIPHPIQLQGLSGGISIKPAAKLNCKVSLAFAKWVRNELVPSSRMRYFSGIKTIYQMSSYSCRKMNSNANNPWSEHAHGNAIDVGKFVLKSGKEIDVRKKGFFAFREKGLLKAVRADSCKYFNTVLGPGSDPHHKDHFHFDLRSRKSGHRYCDL